MGRKKTVDYYFNSDVDDAIMEYNLEENTVLKNKIFQERIHPVLCKLIDILINKGNFYNLDGSYNSTRYNALNHIFDRLHLYKKESGKAYSYCTVIINRYFINKQREFYNSKVKSFNQIYTRLDNNDEMMIQHNEKIEYSEEEDLINENDRFLFFNEFINYLDCNLSLLFKKQMDREIAGAILHIISRREALNFLHKKAIYIYVREITCDKYTSQQIAKIFNIYKKVFRQVYLYYIENGTIDINYIPNLNI